MTAKVYAAINQVQAKLAKTGIAKDKTAEAGKTKFKFRGIDDVYGALAPFLAEEGLTIVPRVLEREVTERVNKYDTVIFYVTVKVEYLITAAEDGSQVVACVYGEAMDTSDKATNKALSAAYKYLCFQTFCIPTEGDNDADATEHEVQPRASNRSYFESGAKRKQFFDGLIGALRSAQTIEQVQGLWGDNREKMLEIRKAGNDEDRIGVKTAVEEYDAAKKRIERLEAEAQAVRDGFGPGFTDTPADAPLVDDAIMY